MKNLISSYIQIISEENGIKTLFLPSGIKKFNFISFVPFKYNNVAVFQSSLHYDLNHVLNQINARSTLQYTLNDIFIIVK